MITMHPPGVPSIAVKVTVGEEPSRVEQKDDIAVAAVGEEECPGYSEFRIGQDSTALSGFQFPDDRAAGDLTEKPVTRHRRIIDR